MGPPGSASEIASPATNGARTIRAHSSSEKSLFVVIGPPGHHVVATTAPPDRGQASHRWTGRLGRPHPPLVIRAGSAQRGERLLEDRRGPPRAGARASPAAAGSAARCRRCRRSAPPARRRGRPWRPPRSRRGVRLERAGPDQLDRDHRAAAADVADHVVAAGAARAAAPVITSPIRRARAGQVLAPPSSRSRRARRRRRPGCRRRCRRARRRARASMISARPVTAGQRQAAGDALGGGDQVRARRPRGRRRTSRRCGRSRSGSRRRRTRRRWRVHQSAQRGQEAGRRHDEAALALDRLDHDAGDVVGADLLLDQVESRAPRPARRSCPPGRGTGRTSAPGRPPARTARSECLYGMFFAVSAIVRLVRPW